VDVNRELSPPTATFGGLRGGLLVCGTTSDAGKSLVVTGLCRLLARNGVRVAPFKAQNMANNSFVTAAGEEIGRAQGVQALAAGAEPEVAMNPILLKPTADAASQVVINGRPAGHLTAAEYHVRKPALRALVAAALTDLRTRFDVVVAEGAGSPTEINLRQHDLVNLAVARAGGMPAVVVGDIDRGGVFAALYGTVALLPPEDRALVRGFVINKFRGDPALLGDATDQIEAACGVPTLGVLPWLDDVALDAEDSVALAGPGPRAHGDAAGDELRVAVVRFPRIANFTDLDPLALEPGVTVRYADRPDDLAGADLVILPGTKATVADLDWLRRRGLAGAIERRVRAGGLVLGVCGGYQMLGTAIDDPVESGAGTVAGLGLLDVTTAFAPDKVVRRCRGTAMGQPVHGYQIYHGRVRRGPGAAGWIHLDDAGLRGLNAGAGSDGGSDEGAVDLADATVLGTTVHGLFEADAFRATFLCEVGRRAGKTFIPAGVSFAAARTAQFDRLADAVEANLDIDRLLGLISSASPPSASPASEPAVP
jgi:adenosylcobyric acid synthase